MGKAVFEIETMYNKGDVVIFNYHGHLRAGVITGYCVDMNAGQSVWYDIAVNQEQTLNFMHGGDVAEFDILGKVADAELVQSIYDFVRDPNTPEVKDEIQVEVPSGL